MAVHFPLPYAEIAADIVSGRIDAVEMQALTPGIDGPSIREWYRFLNCGYRLPIVGGTDKMSAEIPLGAIRTYARLGRRRAGVVRRLGGRGPRGSDVRVVGRVRRSARSTATGRATSSRSDAAAGRSRSALARGPPSRSSRASS